MLAAAPSAAVLGIDALDVLVEVHVANGLPQWTCVGTNPPEHGAHDAERPVMRRAYRVDCPNQLWVANFTYVASWRGVVYMTFMIDLLARRIVGLRGHNTLRTDFMWNALIQRGLRPGHGLPARSPQRPRRSIAQYHEHGAAHHRQH